MRIFTINHKPDLKIGMTVYVSRDKNWAYLPAVRWADDAVVDNVLPVLDAGCYGWWDVQNDGALRQILRDSFREEGQYGVDLDSYLLQTDDEFVVGRVQVVGAKSATFEVLTFCKKDILYKLSSLFDNTNYQEKRHQIDLIHVAEYYPHTTYGRGDYRIHFEGGDNTDWERLKDLIDKLPHGQGWNGIWNITSDNNAAYRVFITYDTFDDVGYVVPVDVGYVVMDIGDRWKVQDFIEESIDEDYAYLEEDLALALEDCLNANI